MDKLKTIIVLLNKLEIAMGNSYMLFAANGSLLLVDSETFEVLSDYRIPCDGGDPGTFTDGDREYLRLVT